MIYKDEIELLKCGVIEEKDGKVILPAPEIVEQPVKEAAKEEVVADPVEEDKK